MAKNSLRRPENVDAEIEDENGKLVGTIRVKPTSVMWAKSDAKKWLSVDMTTFAELMEQNGKRVTK